MAIPADVAAYAPPVTNNPMTSNKAPIRGCRRPVRRGTRVLVMVRFLVCWGLLQDVDDEEEANPDHVNKVPVIGHHNRAGSFLMSEGFHGICSANYQQKRN